MGGDWFDRLAVGGKYTGLAALGLIAYRTFTFACNFLAGRFDARQARVEALDQRLAESLGKRLTHLERAERENQSRIRLLEGWVTALATELRAVDPENSRLKELADALRQGVPVPPPDHSLDDLLQHAAARVEGRNRR